MRRMLIAGLALGALSTSAIAADLGPYPRRSVKDAPPPPSPYGYYPREFSWTGLYVGVQGGYGWGTTDASSGPFGGGFNQAYSYDTNGWLGGVHAGYNWQAQQLVIGIEADIEASGINGGGIGTLGFAHQTSVDWMGSVRARFGYSAGATLLYLTGGLAYGDVTVDKAVVGGAAPFASYSELRTGWTLGAGVEHAFTPNITARLEYRYTDLGEGNFSSSALNSIDKSDVTFHAVRAGLSFRF